MVALLYLRIFLLTTILLETVSHLLPVKIPLHPFLSMRSFYILFIVAESSLAIFVTVGTLVAEPFFNMPKGKKNQPTTPKVGSL
jgi:hypothetical protein